MPGAMVLTCGGSMTYRADEPADGGGDTDDDGIVDDDADGAARAARPPSPPTPLPRAASRTVRLFEACSEKVVPCGSSLERSWQPP
jgi:hypothetical protein